MCYISYKQGGGKMSERLIVVGDIHGCYYTMLRLLKEVNYASKDDTLVFVGDYIDRGPHSFAVVQALRNLQQQVGYDKVVCLRGNHEQFAIDHGGVLSPVWEWNGGGATLQSYGCNGCDMSDDIAWFKSLPLCYDAGEMIICHAGLTNPSLEDNSATDLLWGREWISNDERPREKLVVFGHTPSRDLQPYTTKSGDICIDGGCVFGGKLCALVVEESGSSCIVTVDKAAEDTL